jgi:prepilin-type N-terminal cleavage/methylation domain-containing protein
MKYMKKRLAFSLLEVIFVIVILGIISSIGAEIIANVYENYITQRAQHRASIKTQLALNQIVNRLRYAIPNTVVRRAGLAGAAENIHLGEAMGSDQDNYTVLQWVAADGDSFEAITSAADRDPGWSGFCDLDASTNVSIVSRGSNFTLSNAVQGNLGGNGNFAIFFPGDPTSYPGTGAGETITLAAAAGRIVERYKLSWTSYALSVEGGDLFLYYNFTPAIGAAIGGTRTLLLKNVTNFKFTGKGQSTRIKICVEENIGEINTLPSCKEKVVF